MGVELEEDRAQAAENIRTILLHCQSNASTGMHGGGRQVGVELEENRAHAAESVRTITVTLSVKHKYR